jgi:hypothetical protein
MPTALAGLPPRVSEPALVRRDLSVDEGLVASGPACSGVVMRSICVGTGGDSLRWLGKLCIASGSVRWRRARVVVQFGFAGVVPESWFGSGSLASCQSRGSFYSNKRSGVVRFDSSW